MKKILKLLEFLGFKDEIGENLRDYNFLINLDEKEYPKYLAKLFYLKTGEKLPLLKEWSFKDCRTGKAFLNLFNKSENEEKGYPRGQGFRKYIIDKKRCKTFNQKIQYIKLYGITDLMRDCTDKAKVRDYVRKKIGNEYLKPVLQVVSSEESGVRSNNLNFSLSTLNTPLFDKIDFEKLPESFVIKCSHGCKWHYIIKNKEEYMNNKLLVDLTRKNITGWLEQDYSFWCGLELNYHGIEPKILIEQLLRENLDTLCQNIHVYCFNGLAKYIVKIYQNNKISIYDENLNLTEDIFEFNEQKINIKADDLINQSFVLSEQLSKDFIFVRVDWMIYKNKLYFEELTFTPYSGFHKFCDKKKNLKLGKLINLERAVK